MEKWFLPYFFNWTNVAKQNKFHLNRIWYNFVTPVSIEVYNSLEVYFMMLGGRSKNFKELNAKRWSYYWHVHWCVIITGDISRTRSFFFVCKTAWVCGGKFKESKRSKMPNLYFQKTSKLYLYTVCIPFS